MLETDLETRVLKAKIFTKQPQEFIETAKKYQETMMMYSCAIREVQTKLEVLNDELLVRNERSPIEFIKTRVKKPESIIDKLQRKNITVTMNSLSQLNDIAGIRVVCSFLDDIYKIADMLIMQDDITLIEVKDYIKNPKKNGYRSLHLILEVPVFFSDMKQKLAVEVQIRTIAMDFWASLEHQLKYKHDVENEQEIIRELTKCAETIAQTDYQMQLIRDKITKEKTIEQG